MGKEPVVIIGGGIGGLSTALALQNCGVPVRVYERSQQLQELGAGILTYPNGRRCLSYLGIEGAVEDISYAIKAFNFCNYQTGELISSLPNDEVEKRFGQKAICTHRGDLYRILLEEVRKKDPDCVNPGHEFVGLEQDQSGVTVHFKNGVTVRAPVVLGADGNGSSVRSTLVPEKPVRFSGQTAFRALVPIEKTPSAIRDLELGAYRAPGHFFLHYPIRSGKLMNLVAFGRDDEWQAEGWSIPATINEFLATYADFAPSLRELIGAVNEEELFKWGLYGREPSEEWVFGRVALLGDAAHPMTPFLGQGATMAMEDAVVFARAYSSASSVDEGLARYQAVRRTRGNNVSRWSWEEGKALQDPATKEFKGAIGYGLVDYNAATVAV